tara:strand:+ start:1226 stop:2092 length:867 start_codon:yes stop_codon:yes gene_type:complete
MPELPEVEVVIRSLKKTIKNRKIIKITVNNRNLRFKLQKNFEQILKNKIVKDIRRKSKYIIFDFGNSFYTVLHLGMSGTLHIPSTKNISNLSFYSNPNLPKKHNHIIIHFDKIKLIYNDPRRFGYFKILNNKYEFDNYFTRIGPEALDKRFNLIYLENKVKNKKKNIKNLLLDQKIVSGIGNIYANEILYKSQISPYKSVKKLTSLELVKIIKFSRIILKSAIKFGGSSIRDFKGVSGGGGSFQTKFTVYNRENKKCIKSNCKGIIQKRYISNRSTFICNFCQIKKKH